MVKEGHVGVHDCGVRVRVVWGGASVITMRMRVPTSPVSVALEVKTIRRHLRHEKGRRIDNFTMKNDDLIKTWVQPPLF
jgi:hypothetical protein